MVVAVRLVEIHIVGLEPTQRAVNAFHNVLAGEAAIVLTWADVPEHLREDLEAFAALAGQRPTEDLFRPGLGVDVRGVECGDSGVERGPDTCVGGVLGYLGRVRDPVAVRNLTDDQTAAAEVSVLHTISLGVGWIAVIRSRVEDAREHGTLDLGARPHPRLRHPQAAELHAAQQRVRDDSLAVLVGEASADLPLEPAGDEDRVRDDHDAHADPGNAHGKAERRAGENAEDQNEQGAEEKELGGGSTRVDEIASEPAYRPLIPRGQITLVAALHRLADLGPLGSVGFALYTDGFLAVLGSRAKLPPRALRLPALGRRPPLAGFLDHLRVSGFGGGRLGPGLTSEHVDKDTGGAASLPPANTGADCRIVRARHRVTSLMKPA